MRRTRPCWKSSSLATMRQSVNSLAICVWARGRLLATGRRYLAERPCDALSVLALGGRLRPPEGLITLLSTASARTATGDGPNGRVGADRAGLVQEPSLPRRRSFSANLHRDRVSLKVPIQTEAHSNLRHLLARMHRDLHGPALSPQKVAREKTVSKKGLHSDNLQVQTRGGGRVESEAHSNPRHLHVRSGGGVNGKAHRNFL